MKSSSLRIIFFLLISGLLYLSTSRAVIADASSIDEAVRPQISSSIDAVTAGKAFDIVITLNLKEGWHTYWLYAGDAGFPPSVAWQLPSGWHAGPLEFSLPEQFSEPGDMIVYGYKNRSFLKSTITPARDVAPKNLYPVKVSLSWLACSDRCVPGSSMLSIMLPGASGDALPTMAASTSTLPWPETGAPPFAFSLMSQGGYEVISFQGKQGNQYQFFPDPAEGTATGHVTMTENEGRQIITVPWKGNAPFHGLLVEKSNGGKRQGWWLSPSSQSLSATSAENKSRCSQPMPKAWGALLIALASGLLGGFILNLMPCVLPVISLKVFGFIAQARESRSKILCHGLAFIAGIYFWFIGLGLLILLLKASGKEVTWAFQFQNSTFLLVISSLVFLFALNLFGVFEMVLPGSASNSLDKLASKEGYAGSFFQGLFATLLATPCTAPFLGSALGFAFAQSGVVIMVIFFSIATGMALPYFFLSWQPAWVKWVPHRGPWMERVKQFMGFPLLATNLWLLTVLGRQHGTIGVMMTLLLLLALSLSAWIYGVFYSSKKGTRFMALGLCLCIALGAFYKLVPIILAARVTLSPISEKQEESLSSVTGDVIQWVPYSAARLDELRKEGRAVFLDFSAAWCLTCEFNERTAINTPAVRRLLREHHIIPMKADWTNSNPEITQALRQFDRVGIPYYVFYPPGQGSQPIKFSELLIESQLIKAFSQE